MVTSRARGVNSKIKQRIWQKAPSGMCYNYETVFITTHQNKPIWILFKEYLQ